MSGMVRITLITLNLITVSYRENIYICRAKYPQIRPAWPEAKNRLSGQSKGGPMEREEWRSNET